MRPRTRRWMRSPRRLLAALGVATALSALALTWFAWEMLQQDRALDAQREHERLKHQADRVAQTLERALQDADDVLATVLASAGRPLGSDGVWLMLTRSTIDAVPPSKLLFYPAVSSRPEAASITFAEAERLEFEQHDQARAADAYRTLARSAESTIRAGALMRLGGVLKAQHRYEEARAAFREMAALGNVPVSGLPADLIGRDAEWRTLLEQGQPEAARRAARALYDDLSGGRWRLTRGQYEFYAGDAGQQGGIESQAESKAAVTARAAADLWLIWQEHPSPRGRRLVRVDDVPFLLMWRTASDRMAAWIVEPAALLARFGPDPRVNIALTDAEGVVAGTFDRSGNHVDLMAAETRLPWTLDVSAVPSTAAAGFTRNRLVVGGLAVMIAFLIAGTYFIGRAAKEEMELARLKTDIVAAVSHEFRTPLAAIRQLSELLAAGRVPSEARRQQHYESLAGESRRLQRLVENLLDFGRLEAGARPFAFAPVDPRALVEHVVAEFQSQIATPDCPIETAGDAGSLQLLADADALSVALRNLLDNALKYARSAGTIHVNWSAEGDRIALSVRDHGPGIAPAEQARIFQKFVRGAAATAGNVKGAGLGLAMVQHIVIGHGGEVVVSSEPGVGATFTLLLPTVPAT